MVKSRLIGRIALLGLAMLLLSPVVSLAAAPPTGPALILSDGFEAAGGRVEMAPLVIAGDPPASAYWGRITQAKRSGSYGMWCAGSQSFLWNTYPGFSKGTGTLAIPELAEYYSSTLHHYYWMPSIGVSDNIAFSIYWSADSAGALRDTGHWPPIASAWTLDEYELSSTSNVVNLSREAAHVVFWWYDLREGSGQTPTVGQGPTIDDVSVTGYKYGPVRNLTATQIGDQVQLQWVKPYGATGSTAEEDRDITYRVWRAPEGSAPYTFEELTSHTTRLTDTTYVDDTVSEDEDYTYFVQAWDDELGLGYGVGSTKTVFVTVVPPIITLDVSADLTYALPNESITYTYEVTNATAEELTSVSISDDTFGIVGSTGSISPGGTWTTTHADSFPSTGDYSNWATVTATHLGLQVRDSNGDTVFVRNPAVTLQTSASSPVERGTSVSFSYTVNNTGPFSLSSVVVNDTVLSSSVSFGTLSPGERATQTRSVVANTPLDSDSSVTGWYSGVAANDSANPFGVSIYERLAGSTRITTAIESSKRAFPSGAGVDYAVVASAYGWADALPASALAGTLGGPLLLVDQNDVPGAVLSELSRLGVSKVYLVGGTAVLGDGVWNDLSAYTRERLGGSNRYGTSRLIAAELEDAAGSVDTAFVATGDNFPDALAASSVAAAMDAPILLSRRDSLPSETAAALSSLGVDTIVVCGGEGVISSSVYSQLGSYAGSVTRRWGSNRYDTAKSIIEWGTSRLAPSGPSGIFLATGENYPDALAGGVLAAKADGEWRPLMLTKPTSLSSQASSYIGTYSSIRHVGVLGGEGAVSAGAMNSAKALLP